MQNVRKATLFFFLLCLPHEGKFESWNLTSVQQMKEGRLSYMDCDHEEGCEESASFLNWLQTNAMTNRSSLCPAQ
jgi:hypothetical protein